MAGRTKMLCGVLVFGRVAATHVPACETQSKVYPLVPDFQAVLAARCTWSDLADLIEMCALFRHFVSHRPHANQMERLQTIPKLGAEDVPSVLLGPSRPDSNRHSTFFVTTPEMWTRVRPCVGRLHNTIGIAEIASLGCGSRSKNGDSVVRSLPRQSSRTFRARRCKTCFNRRT